MSTKPKAATTRSNTPMVGQNSSAPLKVSQRSIARDCKGVSEESVTARLVINAEKGSSGTLNRTRLFSAEAVEFARLNSFTPLRLMSPERVVQWFEEADAGYLHMALRSWEQIARRDDVIPAVKFKREAAVALRKWSILQNSDIKNDKSLQSEADSQKTRLSHFWNNVRVVDVWNRSRVGGFPSFVEMCVHIQTIRDGAIHFVWNPTPKGLTATLEFVPGWMCENLSGELRYTGPNPSTIYGQPLDPTNWLPIRGLGLMESASIGASLKWHGLNTWAKYCKRYGLPTPIGKTNAAKGTEEWKSLVAAIKGINQDGGAVINQASAIELLTASGTGDTPSSAMVARIDKGFSALWRGGDLATISSSSGQGTGANQQSRESLLIESADCAWVSDIMQRIDAMVLSYYDGLDVEILAYSQIKGPKLADAKQEQAAYEFGVANGVRLSKKTWCEANDLEEADESDDVLAPSPNAPARRVVPAAAVDPAINSNPWRKEGSRFSSAKDATHKIDQNSGNTLSDSPQSTQPYEDEQTARSHAQQFRDAADRIAGGLSQGSGEGRRNEAANNNGSASTGTRGLAEEEARLNAEHAVSDELSNLPFDTHGEHLTAYHAQSQRFIKTTIPGSYGLHVIASSSPDGQTLHHIDLTDGTPVEYLRRQALFNERFHVPTAYEGVDHAHGSPAIVVSQRDMGDVQPEQKQVNEYMASKGFVPLQDKGHTFVQQSLAGLTWYHPEAQVLATDVRPGNFRLVQGKTLPIDINLAHHPRCTPVINSADQSTLDVDMRAAVAADLEPLKVHLAKLLQGGGKATESDWSSVADAVLNSDAIQGEMLARMAVAFLEGSGASREEAESIILKAIDHKES